MMFVYEKGLMSGISATTFAPNTNITRAQIAVIFYRMAGSPVVEGKNHFTDVEYGPGTVGALRCGNLGTAKRHYGETLTAEIWSG